MTNRELAKELMTEETRIVRALVKEHGKKGALKALEEMLNDLDEKQEDMMKTILNQMPKTHDPYERKVQEMQAYEPASELMKEERMELFG